MSITVNSSGSVSSNAGTNPITISCPTAGNDRVLVAGVGSSSGAPSLTSVVSHNGSSSGWVELFDGLDSPLHISGHYVEGPSDTGTLSATLVTADDEVTLHYAVLNEVKLSDPVGTVPSIASGADAGPATITIPSATDDFCLAFPYTGFNGLTPGSGETQQEEEIIDSILTGGIFSEVAVGSSTVIAPTKTADGFDDVWITCGVAFHPKVSSAVMTGTGIGGITEADVVAGGKVITVTITGDTLIPA